MEIFAECVGHVERFSVVVDLVVSKSWIVMYGNRISAVEIVFEDCSQVGERLDKRARRAHLENSNVIQGQLQQELLPCKHTT